MRRRVRAQLWPILETAGAAVAAWYLTRAVFGEDATNFGPIAALICLGATMGEQRQRALELTGGVVLGVLIADVLVRLIGTGPPQVGLMVVLAMTAAAAIGGGGMLMGEAGVSAIIIGSSPPATLDGFPIRPLEALIGGAVAFAVHALLFPPDALLHVSRAAHATFGALGRTLEAIAAALRAGERPAAERALVAARGLDEQVRALDAALAVGRDTARSAPLRRPARSALRRHEEVARHVDFAVRNTRVLARDVLRYARTTGRPAPDLAAAVDELARAVWSLAAAFDEPDRRDEPARHARVAAQRAIEAAAAHADFTLTEIAGQVRSTAADLVRAAAVGASDRSPEGSTEEMLTEPG